MVEVAPQDALTAEPQPSQDAVVMDAAITSASSSTQPLEDVSAVETEQLQSAVLAGHAASAASTSTSTPPPEDDSTAEAEQLQSAVVTGAAIATASSLAEEGLPADTGPGGGPWLPPPSGTPGWTQAARLHSQTVSCVASSSEAQRLFGTPPEHAQQHRYGFLRLPQPQGSESAAQQCLGHDTAVVCRMCYNRFCGNETPGVYMVEFICSLEGEVELPVGVSGVAGWQLQLSAGRLSVHRHGSPPEIHATQPFLLSYYLTAKFASFAPSLKLHHLMDFGGLQTVDDVNYLPAPPEWMPLGWFQRQIGRRLFKWDV